MPEVIRPLLVLDRSVSLLLNSFYLQFLHSWVFSNRRALQEMLSIGVSALVYHHAVSVV